MKKFLAILCIALAAPAWAQTPAKYALVIGNGDYKNVEKLPNPVNDANDMAAALAGLGFTVEKLLDAGLEEMEEAALRLRNRLSASKNSYGFLFYAGHAVEAAGENYLIPVNSDIQSENHLRQRAASAQVWLDNLSAAGNELNVVVLDACRDNPYRWAKGRGGRGLAVMPRAPVGSIVVFSTSAGAIAEDGAGRNSPFTGILLRNIKRPGISVMEVFSRTGSDMLRATNGTQHPEISMKYFDTAYLGARPAAVAAAPAPAVQPAPRPATAPSNRPTMQAAPTVQPAARVERPVPGGFVRVEGGTFQMGSNDGESDEKPVHSVTVKGFYMGKYEVTQKEWAEVIGTTVGQQKNKHYKELPFLQTKGVGDNHPMYYISWLEAVEYCNKRSVKEGLTPAYTVSDNTVTWNRNADGYRLPTEAEWEFAARGGIKGGAEYRYSGSNNINAVAWHQGNSNRSTHEVGTKAPNSLGIYDMSGNVREWCWDWYGGYSSGAQTDPVGASSGFYRVNRGGCYSFEVEDSARRNDKPPFYSDNNYGFRLVRSAP